jgi:hypothetical protein
MLLCRATGIVTCERALSRSYFRLQKDQTVLAAFTFERSGTEGPHTCPVECGILILDG